MSSTEFVFARHGETCNNSNGILQGHLDTALSARGVIQARELAKTIKDFEFDVIYSSDLKRAVQCAFEIRKHFPKIPYIKEPLLRERYFGVHQGQSLIDIGYYDLTYPTMVRHFYECKCPKGETIAQVLNRIDLFIHNCLDKFPNKKILVVTHGGIVMLALNYLADEPAVYDNAKIHNNAEYSCIEVEND